MDPCYEIHDPIKVCFFLLDSVGRDVVDGNNISGQHGVVVAARAGIGELTEDILGLVEGHQTHTHQGETGTRRGGGGGLFKTGTIPDM